MSPLPVRPERTSRIVSHEGTCGPVQQPGENPASERASDTELMHVRLDRFFPDAKEVSLAGSFNGWQPAATPMEPVGFGCGQWKADLRLKPGEYEYRFFVDGNWCDDPFARTFVANSFGTRNSVLNVSAEHDGENGMMRDSARGLTHSVPSEEEEFKWSSGSWNEPDWIGLAEGRQELIEEFAYNLYLQRGKEPGHALEDWLEAGKRVRALVFADTFRRG